jgi:hypothetical protein
MTLGDVLAILAAVFIVGASWAAAILLVALAFPKPVARAETCLTTAPGRCAGLGFFALLVCGLPAILLISAAPEPLKLVGVVLLGALGLLVALGNAAIVRLVASRIDDLGSPLTPFGSMTRASVLYVSAGSLPILGWFFFVPAALLLSIGCGLSALHRAKKAIYVLEGVA